MRGGRCYCWFRRASYQQVAGASGACLAGGVLRSDCAEFCRTVANRTVHSWECKAMHGCRRPAYRNLTMLVAVRTMKRPLYNPLALHQAISSPEGNNHDAFIYLAKLGNKDSVPLLIRALRWQPKPLKGRDGQEVFDCSIVHCVDALRSLTGKDFANSADAWQTWWDDTGVKLPPENFKPRTDQSQLDGNR